MQRIIKFRVWNTAAKLMYPSEHFGFDMNGVELQRMPKCEHYDQPFVRNKGGQESMIYMQFTGLYDKNGKEIWEGDIMKSREGYTAVVVFDKGMFMGREYNSIEWNNRPELENECEVVGNIYENPGLIKP